MPFFRLSILFAFFAFSFARAACDDEDDFEIFANEESLGCEEKVSIEITYGDTLILSVKPDTGTYYWKMSDKPDDIEFRGYSFPKFSYSENPPSSVTITFQVRNKNSIKTIEVTISHRTTYTVSFDTDGDDDDTEIDDQEVPEDSLATIPIETPNLTKEGYNFGGWGFDFNTPFDFSTPITEDITIKAIWIVKMYVVSFDTDGGTPSIPFQKIIENNYAKEPKETLTKTGYNFGGWDFDFEKTPIIKDTMVKAKWKISNSFVGDTIIFDSSGYDLDTKLSREHRHYFVASPSRCEIKEKDTIKITIMTKDPDMVLQIKNEGQRPIDEKGLRYEIPFVFGKLGNLNSNTLIYDWFSKKDNDNLPIKSDTIIIETPVPFKDPLIKKKWNSIWFVNNNPKTNGLNDSITEFKWFKNNSEVGDSQYYSATSSNPNDVYNIVMQTSKGNRLSTKISTCQDTEDKENNEQTPKKRLAIKVLGVNEKSLNKDLKVYNLNGKLTKETPAGVYIVKE